MESFGVKLNSGKIMWVAADEVDCRDGAVVFYRLRGGKRQLIAGFCLAHIYHFGLPSVFSQAKPPASHSHPPPSPV